MEKPDQISLNFPSNIEYLPAIRKLVSEIAQVSGFSPKASYRSETIADEICSNAVKFGCPNLESRVELTCFMQPSYMEMVVKDEGGNEEDVEKLKNAVEELQREEDPLPSSTRGRGLKIVRMLSNEMELHLGETGETRLHVVKTREDTEDDDY